VSAKLSHPPTFHCVHSIQSLDFLYGSVLVFFVIKIEKIRAHRRDASDSRSGIHIAGPLLYDPLESHASLSPYLPDRAARPFAEGRFNFADPFLASDVTFGSSRLLTSAVGRYPRPNGPSTTSFFVKKFPFLSGSGSQVESDVTYRKHRGTYQSTRGHNLTPGTMELTHTFASSKATNRQSRGASTPKTRLSGLFQITMFVSESHHV
jgi:hypothetical protein